MTLFITIRPYFNPFSMVSSTSHQSLIVPSPISYTATGQAWSGSEDMMLFCTRMSVLPAGEVYHWSLQAIECKNGTLTVFFPKKTCRPVFYFVNKQFWHLRPLYVQLEVYSRGNKFSTSKSAVKS